jgi:hypothetical protein
VRTDLNDLLPPGGIERHSVVRAVRQLAVTCFAPAAGRTDQDSEPPGGAPHDAGRMWGLRAPNTAACCSTKPLRRTFPFTAGPASATCTKHSAGARKSLFYLVQGQTALLRDAVLTACMEAP